jgi:hypothetical protein
VLNCVYERVRHSPSRVTFADSQKHNRTHEDASDADLEALRYTDRRKSAGKKAEVPIEDTLAALTVEPTAELANEAEDPFKDVPVLSRTTGELYLFDTDTDVFVIQEKEVAVDMASNGDFESKCKHRNGADS